jgi:hypothetical protein
MVKTKLVIEPQLVNDRLADFGITRQDGVRIALAALAARNDSVPTDPKTAPGQLAYIYGVRTMRDAFPGPRYEAMSRQNIESVYDSAAGRKIMFQTVDLSCVEGHIPQPISDIGPAKESVIEQSIPYLFAEMQAEEDARRQELTAFERAEVWYVCTSFANGSVSCELSRPTGVVDRKFADFAERIFLLREGDGGSSGLINLHDDTPPLEIRPVVRKR